MEIKALSLVLSIVLSLAALSAEIITIGTGEVLNQGLPIEPVARYSYSQQLFMPSEIACSGQITSLGFRYHAVSNFFYPGINQWKIWLGHSQRSLMNSWIPLDSLNLVYDNALQVNDFTAGLPGDGWLVITLEQPFFYNGTDRLIVAVDENSSEYGSTSDDFYCTSSGQNYAIQYQNATINPDPDSPPTTGYSLKTHRSNLQIGIEALHYIPVQPLPVNGASGVAINGNLSWTSLCSSFDLKLGTQSDSLQILATGITTTFWQLESPLAFGQQYFWQVIGHQDTQLYPSAIWSFTTLSEPCSPPLNLSGSSDGSGVSLVWQAPSTGSASYYKIYRNSAYLSNSVNTAFWDAAVQQNNTYFYYVTAVTASGSESSPSNLISVSVPYTGEVPILQQGFESCQAFSQLIQGWQNLDLDGSITWDWPQHSFPGEGSAFAWCVFEPLEVQPPLTEVMPYQGAKMAVSLSATNPPNNDWLISPAIHLGASGTLKFMARSADPSFGNERMQVLLSNTDGNWTSFKTLHTQPFIQIPGTWMQYNYDLSSWAGQRVWLAWRCLSVDALALCLDQIEVFSEGGWVGVSDDYLTAPEFISYPNPSMKSFSVYCKNNERFSLELYNLRGQRFFKADNLVSFNSLETGLKLCNGIYILRLSSASSSKTIRQIILK